MNYELANRPGWVAIPLNGILRLLAKTEEAAHARQRSDPEAEAIVAGRHGDPFAFLGMHKTPAGICVRAMLPGAEDGRRHRLRDRRSRRPGERIHPRRPVRRRASPTARSRSAIGCGLAGAVHAHEFDDVYRFPPVLGDLDMHLLVEGNHLASYQKLGSHPLVHDGVEGVAFAVWAPNAHRVSVVGDFNDWDGRRMPMRRRHAGGFWELFVPGLRPGHLYKYEILGADGALLPLKADPYAERAEKPPGTASVVAAPVAPCLAGRRLDGRALGSATTATRRSRSTRCISARGAATSRRTGAI